VQVGRYAGEHQPDEKCPNCGQREIAEHLMLCPNQDRTRLLKEQTESLEVATPRRQNRNRTILLDPKVYKNERHETVCRNGGHVGHNAEHSRESRQDRVEALH